jgi:cobalt-zinc-cadmium efflux system membrane fusion protein
MDMHDTMNRPVPSSVADGRVRASFFGWLCRGLPTLLVLLGLGTVAYWGHRAHWKLPPFASLVGRAHEAKGDWCDEHGVPESQCVECQPGLLPRGTIYGWCDTHGVHECPLEHPDVAQLASTPRVTAADFARAERALSLADRPTNNPKYRLYLRRIQFASQEAIDKAGVDLAPAWEAPIVEAIAANGEVTYDPTRVASLAGPVPGQVWRVEKTIGEPVKKDEVLALVDALEVGKAKGEFMQALAQVELRTKAWERMRPFAGDAVSGREAAEAEAALREAQIRLVSAEQALVNLGLPVRAEAFRGLAPEEMRRRMQFLGLPEPLAKTFDARTTTANLIPVRAPFDGVVIARKAVEREMADASKMLFVVADPSRLWLTLHIRQDDLKPFREKDPERLLRGKRVLLHPDGTRLEVTTEIAWVSTAADERTRTLLVRANVANPGWLRANTFGTAQVILREEKRALTVPDEAVQWDGNAHLVFVYDRNSPRPGAPKVFHVRTVRPGVSYQGNTEIIAGLLKGEMVVTRGSGTLRGELLKASLGEG